MPYLVLMETSGNQTYLFATNRLRENVGASELTWRSGTEWVLKAITADGGPDLWSEEPPQLRENIRCGERRGGFEVIVATSGKAIVLVEDADKARRLVSRVTREALTKAPGLDISGAIIEYDRNMPIHDQIKTLHRRFNQIRQIRPSPALRFQQLPIVARCASSGLPAAGLATDPDGESRPVALAVQCKQEARGKWRQRIVNILRYHGRSDETADLWFPKDLDKAERLFQDMDWIAVVHADGNGMGQTFLNFDSYSGCKGDAAKNDAYLDALRHFSLDLDAATEAAFIEACTVLPSVASMVNRHHRLFYPLIPLVLGGDDLTVLVDGRYSLAFAREFLRAFEHEAGKRLIPNKSPTDKNHGFGACAGVSIIKPHFPFHTAYELAETLLRSAKTVKTHLGPGGSALDFHILFDASFTSLSAIRDQLSTDAGKTILTAGPYVVSQRISNHPDPWVSAHDIGGLACRVDALSVQDEETQRKRLPNSQIHALRESLFQGRKRVDSHLCELMIRYEKQGLKHLCEGDLPPWTLFREQGDGKYETRFLDALTSAPFWQDARAQTDEEDDGDD